MLRVWTNKVLPCARAPYTLYFSSDTKAYNIIHIAPCSRQPSGNYMKLIQGLRKKSAASLWPPSSCSKQRNLGSKSPNHERRSAKSSRKDTQYTRAIYSAVWHYLPATTSLSEEEMNYGYRYVQWEHFRSWRILSWLLWSLFFFWLPLMWEDDWITDGTKKWFSIWDKVLGDIHGPWKYIKIYEMHQIQSDTNPAFQINIRPIHFIRSMHPYNPK